MEERPYSDRVYTTLLWEFMQFAKSKVWDSSFVESTAVLLARTGQAQGDEAKDLVAREETLRLIPACSAQLFLDFILENPDVVSGPDELLAWVTARQKNYPLE